MKKLVGIVINLRKREAINVLRTFFKNIKNTNYQFYLLKSIAEEVTDIPDFVNIKQDEKIFTESDLIISFGGDGTILRTVHLINRHEIPILGVNIGSLGFLAATSPESVTQHIDYYFKNPSNVDRRSILKMEIQGNDKTWYAFNDIVIDKAGFHRVINIITKINDRLLNSYIADGLIISTPTGSTAYSLANGGPIVIPSESKVFIVNPICPHTLSNRPVVFPDSAIISLQVQSELNKFQLIGDGQSLGTFSTKDTINISRAEFDAVLVNVPGNDFYTTLRSKLGWGEDFRNKSRWD